MTFYKNIPVILLLTLSLGSLMTLPAYAQQVEDIDSVVSETGEFHGVPIAEEKAARARAKAIVQLAEIQQTLTDKIAERKILKRTIVNEGVNAGDELTVELEALNQDIGSLENTFNQIASDGAQLADEERSEQAFDWQEELISIVKPLIENVKGLTEKPRKIESLRRSIEEKNRLSEATKDALESIGRLSEGSPPEAVESKFIELQSHWEGRLLELERERNLAEFQLNNLEGRGIPWTQTVKEGLNDFIRGRGLTLVLAAATVLLIWSVMWSILWLIRKRTQASRESNVKIGYRLTAWAYKLLTALLISIGVMSVFYFRQDLLLLAIMLVIFFGAALALRNLLPRYVNEARLLLNLGSVREREQVMHRGIPWRVDLINVQTYLSNPEISGVVRLPLNALHEMVSRPIGKSRWFPSSKGDWVIGSDVSPLEVLWQGVEMIELRSRNGIMEYVPTADYFAAGYRNLSRNGTFRVRATFGVDYNLQHIPTAEIGKAFSESIKQHVKTKDYAEQLVEVRVEFDSAGESSLNYYIAVRFRSAAAQFYRPIQRLIQQACVAACTEKGWGIPFPQLTIHRPAE